MEVKGAAKLQEEFHQAWLVCGTLEAAGSYWQAKQNATNMVKQLSRARSGSGKPLDNSGEKAASSLTVYIGGGTILSFQILFLQPLPQLYQAVKGMICPSMEVRSQRQLTTPWWQGFWNG